VAEKGYEVSVVQKLGFGTCRISLAIAKTEEYNGPAYFNGKRVATSYPRILAEYFAKEGVEAEIHEIAGSVEIAPAVGMADAIFDIVSSGGTLVSNGLKEVEKVLFSEAVLIANPGLPDEKRAILEQLEFRFGAALESRGMKYVLMNIPAEAIDKAIEILPAMRSPTVMPLAQKEWCSLHSVVRESELWDKIEQLKTIGAEGILVLALEKIVR
jgi:ATP phosphoribosyltransferase